MSFGKINSFIDIISVEPVIDSEGFSTKKDTIIASVRAYKEERHGSQKWANMASFSDATALFRFRKIPGITITASHVIVSDDGRYNIISVENVKGKCMYIEVLAKIVAASQQL